MICTLSFPGPGGDPRGVPGVRGAVLADGGAVPRVLPASARPRAVRALRPPPLPRGEVRQGAPAPGRVPGHAEGRIQVKRVVECYFYLKKT